jgi:hypothetical protein
MIKPLQFWTGFVLFFAIGVVVALATAFRIIDRGGSVVAAVTTGSMVGGYTAWFMFFVTLNAIKQIRTWRQSSKKPGEGHAAHITDIKT